MLSKVVPYNYLSAKLRSLSSLPQPRRLLSELMRAKRDNVMHTLDSSRFPNCISLYTTDKVTPQPSSLQPDTVTYGTGKLK